MYEQFLVLVFLTACKVIGHGLRCSSTSSHLFLSTLLPCLPHNSLNLGSCSLHLDSEGSTVNSCYYCGPDLRIICSTVDSERAQVPDQSASAYVSILDAFNQLSVYAHAVVSTAQEGATVGSVRINTHRKVPGLDAGVLPYDTDEVTVTLGSTMGSFPITSTSANAGVARVADYARTLSKWNSR